MVSCVRGRYHGRVGELVVVRGERGDFVDVGFVFELFYLLEHLI